MNNCKIIDPNFIDELVYEARFNNRALKIVITAGPIMEVYKIVDYLDEEYEGRENEGESDYEENEEDQFKLLYTFKPNKIFITRCSAQRAPDKVGHNYNDDDEDREEEYSGLNVALLDMNNNEYVYVGCNIYKFRSNEIIDFFSKEWNAVSSSIAVDIHNNALLLDDEHIIVQFQENVDLYRYN